MKCMHFLGEGLGMEPPRNTDTSEWKMIVKGSALTKALCGDKHDISLKNLQKAKLVQRAVAIAKCHNIRLDIVIFKQELLHYHEYIYV